MLIGNKYLEQIYKYIPNYDDCCKQTKYVKTFSRTIAHNYGIHETHIWKKENPCGKCGNIGVWNRCSGCKEVHYCSIKCQKDAWLYHKNECTKYW